MSDAAWVPAPSLTVPELTGTFWRFGRLDGMLFGPFVVLAPEGLIGGYLHVNEDLWQVVDGRLAFYTSDGVVSTLFERAQIVDGEIVALAGRVLLPDRDLSLYLRRTEHPEIVPQDASAAPRIATFLKSLDGPRRPNLVVVRAGEHSLHPHWFADGGEAGRSWDLGVSYYGRDPGELAGPFEWLTHQPEQRKFQAIHDMFRPESPLWAYERIWLPDDDLRTDWRNINRMFQLTRKYGLLLAQPSLVKAPDCHVTHPITEQRPDSLLRFTNFVEVMCPVFSRESLRICIGTFRDSKTGFGLDHLWPRLIGSPETRVAILDDVGVVHTRPFAQNYDVYAAMGEEWVVHNVYGFRKPGPQEITSVGKERPWL